MNRLTHVYIPQNRRKEKEEFKDWCLSHVSSYSTEATWTYSNGNSYHDNKPVMIFNFFEASDAMAFKLRFGL